MKPVRLDKFLSDMKAGTRSQVKNLIRKGRISVNGAVIKSPGYKVSEKDCVMEGDHQVSYRKYEYLLLNNPAGVVSATEDKKEKTVLDLVSNAARGDLFPVGRLDKDTEGLLLLTNDGRLAHDLLSPKKHVSKTYLAKISGQPGPDAAALFAEGLDIGEKGITLPARLEILKTGEESIVRITIQEGRYHQVKRMFEAIGCSVIYLRRISMGTLKLDDSLLPGNWRPLTDDELSKLIIRNESE